MGSPLDLDLYATEESGLVGYWRFDELEDLGVNENHGQIADGSDDVRDYSVNGFHGDLSGESVGLSDIYVVNVKESDKIKLIREFTLQQNYPNPFNPTTTIDFAVAQSGNVNLTVYNVNGQKMITLVDEQLAPGSYKAQLNGQNWPSGFYFYRLTAGGQSFAMRMLLIK